MGLWKTLSDEQEQEFRQWARDNYVPGESINGVWHEIVQDECVKINREQFA